MGLLSKASPEKSLAVATLVMGSQGEFDFSWQGDTSFALRAPAVYLDWALNKDHKAKATRALDTLTTAFAAASRDDPEIDLSPFIDGSFKLRDVEVVVGVTEMRGDVSFRPRTAVATHMYVTFAGLWNGLVLQLGRDGGDDAIESLLDDMREQLDIHHEMGVSMRGGVAPMLAGQRGAGRRLEAEIAVDATDSRPDEPVDDVVEWRDEIDVDAIYKDIAEIFADVQSEKGSAEQYYPRWFMRRLVGTRVLAEAGLKYPGIVNDLDGVFGDRDPMEEDPQLDQDMDELLRFYDLEGVVSAIINALSAA